MPANPITVEIICPLRSHGCSTSAAPCNLCGTPRREPAGTLHATLSPGGHADALRELVGAACIECDGGNWYWLAEVISHCDAAGDYDGCTSALLRFLGVADIHHPPEGPADE